MCVSFHRWRWLAHEKLCTMVGTRTIPRTRRLSYICSGSGRHSVYVDPLAAEINDVQELSKTHEAISRAKTETWHRILTHYLPLYFPEIERFAGNSRSDWFLALMERFPTPGSIMALGSRALTGEAWSLVSRKVSKARLINDIYETASSSIALAGSEDASGDHYVPHDHG